MHTRRLLFWDVSIRNSLRSNNYFPWSPAAVENKPFRREDGRSRTCLQPRRKGSRQSSFRNPRAHIRARPPVAVTSAPLLLPTPSIPCLRSPKSRSAFRLEVVHAANQAGNQAGNLVEIFSVTTPGSPRPGPGRTLPKDDAGSSCGCLLYTSPSPRDRG